MASRWIVLILFILLNVCFLGFYITPEFVQDDQSSHHSTGGVNLLSHSHQFSKPADDSTAQWIEQVSWEPRVFVFHNIMTQEECKEVIRIGEKDLSESLVVAASGGSAKNDARTSNGVFLGSKYMKENPLLRNLERRAADWTHMPLDNGEVFYLLRYEEGQQYKPHHDWFSDDETGRAHIGASGNRVATVLFYLRTPEAGGETIFPNAVGGPIQVEAKAGDAVLFWDALPDGSNDPKSLHGGNPVLKGVKWAMTKWIRANSSPYSWRYHTSATEMLDLEKKEFEWLAAQKH